MRAIQLYSSLIIALFILGGCSSDDDGGPSGPQVPSALYDEWTTELLIINGETDGNISCEERIDYKFNSNGTYNKEVFTTNASDNCESSLNITGNWEVLTEQSIMLTPNSSAVQGETLNFELISSNTKLQINRNASRTEIYEKL